MRPFRFIAKCQEKTIEEQYKLGVRMFDIRIRYDNFIPEFRHGSMAFKGEVEPILKQLNSYKEPIYIRLILELNKRTRNKTTQEIMFQASCRRWEKIFKHLKFFCGRSKYNWKQLYKFELDDIDLNQYVSSMSGHKIYSVWPWLYSKLNNKGNLNKRDITKWSLFDFL